MSLRSWFDKTPDIDPYDWELEMELEEAAREAEWEASLEKTVKCDICGMTDFAINMWALGYGNKFLCDMCWDEVEEEDY